MLSFSHITSDLFSDYFPQIDCTKREPLTGDRVCIVGKEQFSVEREDPVEDIDIVKRIQTGDSESYSLLIEKYHRHLLNFIYRLLGNEEVVEDIGQEVFFSVYKSMRSFNAQRGVPFAAWLFITARNRCISELRKKNRHTVSMDMLGGLPTDAKSPEESASQKERMAAIHNALEQLPEPFKQTILQSLRGDSPDAIARNLHISPGTVKSRLSRARQKMKLLLHGSLGGNVYGRF